MKLDREIEVAYSVSIHQLAAGQSEAALLVIKKDDVVVRSVLIDSGFEMTVPNIENVIKENLEDTALSAVVTTHYDRDHFRGIIAMLNNNYYSFCFNSETVFYDIGIPSEKKGNSTYSNYVRGILGLALDESLLELFENVKLDKNVKPIFRDVYRVVLELDVLGDADDLAKIIKKFNDGEAEDYIITLRERFDRKVDNLTSSIKKDDSYMEGVIVWLGDKFHDLIRLYFNKVIKMWPATTRGPQYLVDKEMLKIKGEEEGGEKEEESDEKEEEEAVPTLTCLCLNQEGGFDGNNRSIALLLKLGDFSFFTAGDLESDYEDQLAKNMKGGMSVFKVSHHGSYKSTSKKFLSETRPVVALISSGTQKGHPSKPLLKRLSASESLQHVFLTQVRYGICNQLTAEPNKFRIAGTVNEPDEVTSGNITVQYAEGQDVFSVYCSDVGLLVDYVLMYPLRSNYEANYGRELDIIEAGATGSSGDSVGGRVYREDDEDDEDESSDESDNDPTSDYEPDDEPDDEPDPKRRRVGV